MARRFELSQLAASRLVGLRQHEKYIAFREDALAPISAIDWRLAVLSARAALGFALDVLRAQDGIVARDEVYREVLILQSFSARTRRRVLRLLRKNVKRRSALKYTSECIGMADSCLKNIGFHPPFTNSDHKNHDGDLSRLEWMKIATSMGSLTLYSRTQEREILKKS